MDATAEAFWTTTPYVTRTKRVTPAPPRVKLDGPVLIGDCAASWGGRPMLLVIMDGWREHEED